MAKRRKPSFGGKRSIFVKRGAKCPRGMVKKIIRTRTNPHVEMCKVR